MMGLTTSHALLWRSVCEEKNGNADDGKKENYLLLRLISDMKMVNFAV